MRIFSGNIYYISNHTPQAGIRQNALPHVTHSYGAIFPRLRALLICDVNVPLLFFRRKIADGKEWDVEGSFFCYKIVIHILKKPEIPESTEFCDTVCAR